MREPMPRANPAAVALVLALSPGLARAAPAPDIDCRKAMATPEVAWCAQKDLEAADTRLNAAYRAAQAAIAGTDVPDAVRAEWRKALIEAQRRWIAFRDGECAVTGFEWYGGTGRGAAELTCRTQLTDARTVQLRAHAAPR